MLPYWLVFSVSAFGALQNRVSQHRLGRVTPGLALFALVILLLVGLRYRVGGDWGNYLEIFSYLQHVSFRTAITLGDPGYSFLNSLAWQFGYGVWFVNLICALIFTWGLQRFAAEQPNPWLAFVVAIPYLVIVVAMGYTRQAVAIGFALASLSSLRRNGSMARFIVYMLIAATFHRSAIVLVPLVALARTKNRLVIIALGALLMAMLFYFFVYSSLDVMIRNYEGQSLDAQGAVVRVSMNVLPAILFLSFQRRFAFDAEDRNLWRNFSIAALVALFLLYYLDSSVVVDRLSLYLIPVQLAIFSRTPLVFSEGGKPNGLVTIAVILYSATVQFVWLNFADNANYWLPYRWYPLAS